MISNTNFVDFCLIKIHQHTANLSKVGAKSDAISGFFFPFFLLFFPIFWNFQKKNFSMIFTGLKRDFGVKTFFRAFKTISEVHKKLPRLPNPSTLRYN